MSAPDDSWHIDPALAPLADQLRARYPGVRVVRATFTTLDDGTLQQNIRFAAPLARLLAAGLCTEAMVANARLGCVTPIGDGYSLYDCPLDALVEPGNYDLSIFTGTRPRERERFSVKDAERELRRFTLAGRRRGQRGPAWARRNAHMPE